jgi:hypothetical protein
MKHLPPYDMIKQEKKMTARCLMKSEFVHKYKSQNWFTIVCPSSFIIETEVFEIKWALLPECGDN